MGERNYPDVVDLGPLSNLNMSHRSVIKPRYRGHGVEAVVERGDQGKASPGGLGTESTLNFRAPAVCRPLSTIAYLSLSDTSLLGTHQLIFSSGEE